MHLRLHTVGPLIAFIGVLGIAFAGLNDAHGTPEPSANTPAPLAYRTFPAALVRQIQHALSRQGFYLGPVNGLYGARTAAAIRAYQTSAEYPVVDGLPSPQLALDLKTNGQIGRLLSTLEKSRTATVKAARTALLSHPQTRALIEDKPPLVNAPLNIKACLAMPTPRCLLQEAVASARDIEKPQMRDWALGEILVAQARAGLAAEAMVTTRRIHDPRLIMVALRNIANAQAETGRAADALKAVDMIPDEAQQIEATLAIAAIYARRDHTEDVAVIAARLERNMVHLKSPLAKIAARTRMAVILHRAGLRAKAQITLRTANTLSTNLPPGQKRDKALRYLAAAYGETGNPTKELALLKGFKTGSDDTPKLIASAVRLAQNGDAKRALITADSIEAVRYRALVLARIAAYQVRADDAKKARTTLDKAQRAARSIRFPYARAYALSRIALVFDKLDLGAALSTAQHIRDKRLKAQTLWTIADARLRGGDKEGAQRAKAAAKTATADIHSPFSRVWMLSTVAEGRARHQEPGPARTLFRRALNAAATLTHPWARARAFAKVAATLNALNTR